MGEHYEAGSLHSVAWFPGSYTVADLLTKHNRKTVALLQNVPRTGIYPIHAEQDRGTMAKREVLSVN